MLTLAYIREKSEWRNQVWLSFSDLIGCKQPAFVSLAAGDMVLTLDPERRPLGVAQEWLLRRVFRVSNFEETGDAFEYRLDLQCVLSPPEGTPLYAVSRAELLWAHNWFPDPDAFFKPFPRAVWNWLRDVKGVPLPAVPAGE
jgi:hypothetical protein